MLPAIAKGARTRYLHAQHLHIHSSFTQLNCMRMGGSVVVGFYYIRPRAHKVGQPLCDSPDLYENGRERVRVALGADVIATAGAEGDL